MRATDMQADARVERLGIRARVALAASCARRAAQALASHPEQQRSVVEALEAAANWAAGRAVEARDLYRRIHALFALEPALAGDAGAKAALFAAISALYYATWHADRAERRAQPETPRLPNDMADVGEDTLEECLDYAAGATGGEGWKEWLARTIADLVSREQES